MRSTHLNLLLAEEPPARFVLTDEITFGLVADGGAAAPWDRCRA